MRYLQKLIDRFRRPYVIQRIVWDDDSDAGLRTLLQSNNTKYLFKKLNKRLDDLVQDGVNKGEKIDERLDEVRNIIFDLKSFTIQDIDE